jgi:hypothetical protein
MLARIISASSAALGVAPTSAAVAQASTAHATPASVTACASPHRRDCLTDAWGLIRSWSRSRNFGTSFRTPQDGHATWPPACPETTSISQAQPAQGSRKIFFAPFMIWFPWRARLHPRTQSFSRRFLLPFQGLGPEHSAVFAEKFTGFSHRTGA